MNTYHNSNKKLNAERSKIPVNSRKNFYKDIFPGIQNGNSRTGIPGGLGFVLSYLTDFTCVLIMICFNRCITYHFYAHGYFILI